MQIFSVTTTDLWCDILLTNHVFKWILYNKHNTAAAQCRVSLFHLVVTNTAV